MQASPIVTSDGSVLLGAEDGYVHVLSKSTGAQQGLLGSAVSTNYSGTTVTPFNGPVHSTPAVGYDNVYVLTSGSTPVLYRIHFSEQ